MEYRNLGRSGLKVSRLCLGTMTFGWGTDEKNSHRMLDIFIEKGGNFIDTADIYADGKSETIIGRWLSTKQRDDIVLATKARFTAGPGPNDVGSNRKHLAASLDSSLRRLNTDYIDLFQIHGWDESTPLEETIRTVNTFVASGKVRYLGLSNFTGWQLQKAMDICHYEGRERFVSFQGLYNLLDRYLDWDIIPVCKREGLGLLCWSPLGGGWLSGKFHRGMSEPPRDSRVKVAEEEGWSESWSNYNEPHTWDVLDELDHIAKVVEKPVAQVAINWLQQCHYVQSPVLGCRTIQQFEDNLAASTWTLSKESMDHLNRVSYNKPPRYPYGFLNRFNPAG